ncbi:MAG: HEAT repeat domain-containing protein [Planctomycetota bacterium]
MTIEVECPKCGAFLRLEEHLAGKQVECTECGGVMTIPRPDRPPAVAAAPPAEKKEVTFEDRMAVEAEKVRRQQAIPILAKHPGKMLLVVAIVLLALLLVNLPWLIQRIKVQGFISLLESKSMPDRRAAAKELAKSPNVTAVKALIKFARDDDPSIRQCCVQGLGKVGDQRASEVLVQLLKDPVEPIRADAAWALATCGAEDAKAPLREALRGLDESGQVEAGARYALFALGEKEQFDALITMLTTSEDHGRVRAAQALGEIGNPDAIYYLEKAASSNPAIVKAALAKAITKIQEKKY